MTRLTSKTASKDFEFLIDNAQFSTCVLYLGTERQKVHISKGIYAARANEYFAPIFESSPNCSEVELPDICNHEVFKLLNWFLYTGSVEVPCESVGDLLQLAAKLHIYDLVFALLDELPDSFSILKGITVLELSLKYPSDSRFITWTSKMLSDFASDISMENALHILKTISLSPHKDKFADIAEKAINFIASNIAVYETDGEFWSLDTNNFLRIMQSDELAYVTEKMVWLAILKKSYFIATNDYHQDLPCIQTAIEELRGDEELVNKVQNAMEPLLHSWRYNLMSESDLLAIIGTYGHVLPRKFSKEIGQFYKNISTNSIPESQFPRFPRLAAVTEQSKIMADKDLANISAWINRSMGKTCKRSFQLIFRGSNDGFSASDFHSKCDGKGPTMVVVKSKHGHVGGGFTNVSWQSPQKEKLVADPHAFIFTLKGLPVGHAMFSVDGAHANQSVCHDATSGPFWTVGLCLSTDCVSNAESYNYLNSTYRIPSHLFGSANFQVSDYEVYTVE